MFTDRWTNGTADPPGASPTRPTITGAVGSTVTAMPTAADADPGLSAYRADGSGDGPSFYLDVPAPVRTGIDRLTAAVARDRRLQATGSRRRVPPVVGLPVLAAAAAALMATTHPAAVAVGVLLLLAVAVLGFVPVRRWRRRTRLRRLHRRWGAHRIDRLAIGPRWRPAVDTVAATDRHLRAAGPVDAAADAATVLDEVLLRARAGTCLDTEITHAAAALTGAPTRTGADPAGGDPDVAALRADLHRARETAAGLLEANTAAADHLTAAAADRAGHTAAIEAVRVRALGALTQATTDATALLPDPPPPPR